MIRTDACGEPRTQSESTSGGASPSCPRPSGRWHDEQIVVYTVLPASKRASSSAVNGGGATDGATPGLPGHSTMSLVEGPEPVLFSSAALTSALFRSAAQPSGSFGNWMGRRAAPGPVAAATSAVDERCGAGGRRGQLRSRERDQSLDRRYLTRTEHASGEPGDDRVGLDVGDWPRGIGEESLDE